MTPCLTPKQITPLINRWLDIAEGLLCCGAEIYRVEDSLTRLARAYGATGADVFVITSSIVLTVSFENAEQYTVTRRIRRLSSTDFTRLERYNALCRKSCAELPAADALAREINAIKAVPASRVKTTLGSVLVAAAFAVFFGGAWREALLAGLFGGIINLALARLSHAGFNRAAQYVLCSLGVGIPACVLARLIPGLMPDKIIVGTIMLTIPGISTTNSLRDMLVGDTLSGLLRLIQSLLEAFILAGSFMAAVWLMRGNVAYTPVADGAGQLIPAALGSVGFALVFNCEKRHLWAATLGGLACWGIYLLCELKLGAGGFVCAFVSALAADLIAEACARLFKAPSTLFLISFIIPLIPGCSLFYAFSDFVYGTPSGYGMNTFLAVAGIAIGIGCGASALHRKTSPQSGNKG